MNLRLKAILGVFSIITFLLMMNAAPNPAAAAETDMIDISKKVFPSVVRVEVLNTIRKVATGVVFDGDGHIVTTALVSPRDEKIQVITSDGEKLDAEFLGMDVQTNLAVIKAKDKKLKPIEMGEKKEMPVGSWIGVVGFSPENTLQVTDGIISSVNQETLRLNVWVWKGSSGSPVVDDKGRMVGLLRGVYIDESPVVIEFEGRQVTGSGYMVSKAEAPSSGLAVAVPLSVVDFVSGEIKEKGKVERGWLGVSIAEDEEGRVEVLEVEKDSPAEEAGLQEGDIIIDVGNTAISGSEMLVNEVRKHKPGETVTLRIEREGKTQRVKVELGEYTEQDIWKEFETKFPSLFRIPESLEKGEPFPRTFRFPFEGQIFREKSGIWLPFEGQKHIGVNIEALDKELSEFFGLKEGVGILVRSVDKDGPASKAGLKVGDLIVKADGKRVETTDELVGLIQKKEKGETIELEILRDKKKMTVEVEIDEEESDTNFFPSLNLDRSSRNWESFSEAAKKQISEWNDQKARDSQEKIKKYREEMEKKSETVLKELNNWKKKNEIFFNDVVKTYRHIKA